MLPTGKSVIPSILAAFFHFSLDSARKMPALAVACVMAALAGSGVGSIASAQTKTATTTTLAVTAGGSAATTVAPGSVVTLTASVDAGSAAVNPGLVSFCDASAKYCTDVHLLGTAQLTGAGTATLKFRPGIGGHSYKAVFLGTTTRAASSSSASALKVTGVIPPVATATTINQTGSWGGYTLSATVTETGNTAAPTDSVSFLDTNNGNAVLGTGALGAATRGVAWSTVNTSAPSLAGVSYAVADLNGDGIPDLFVKDYFGTYDVFLGNGDGTFTAKGSAFGPYSETGTFIVGDFNNDGIPDVAAIDATDYASNTTITIFLGNGDGTFAAAGSSPSIGYNPTAIATADINGDGNADLIVVQQGSSTSSGGQVVVFFGNGDGTFTQASTAASVTSTASSIIPADLNGDGNIDLVLSGNGQSGVTVLLGKGDGTFTVTAGPAQAGEATVAVADLNDDGIPDLVFGAATNSYLTVFLGNGDGTFTAAPSSSNGNLVIGNSVAVADLNQDGIPDVVYSNGSTTGILFGKADGTFVQSPATLSFATYGFGTAFVVADFNGDGWPDVLAIDGSGRTIADSLNHPTETATATATVSLPAAGQHLVDASYAGDGNYNPSTSGTIPLWGAPAGTTITLAVTAGGSPVTSVAPGTVVTLTATVKAGSNPVTAGTVSFCDASATACTDIHLQGTAALSSNGTAAFKFVPGPGVHSYKAVFAQNGYGLGSSSAGSALTVGPAKSAVYTDTTAITAGGYPGDYALTATVTGFGGSASPTGNVSFLDTSFGNASLATAPLGASTAGLGWLISQTPAASGNLATEVTGDFNGDGIPDLAVLWTTSSYGGSYSVAIFFGKGDGTFTTGPTVQPTGMQRFPTMISGDFNGDGKADLAILSWNGYSASYVTTLLGNGDGTFGTPQTGTVFNQGSFGGGGDPGSVVAADFNGDGKMDLAIVGDCVLPGGAAILLGNGDGTFKVVLPNLDPTADFGLIATGDFNGDGIPDLVVTNYSEFGTSPIVFLGKGDGTFTSVPMSFTLDYFPKSVVVGDFNGDGALDLAFSDLQGVEIALGNGDGTFKETSASPIEVPNELYSLQVGDFNHDGKLDLAGLDNYHDQIVLLLGAGDGTFAVTATTPAVSQDWLGPFALVAADFNGDGVPDLAMLTSNTTTASILLTGPTQTATATVTGIAPVGAATHNVQASYPGDSNYPSSSSSTVALTAALALPVISPASGAYTTVQTVTITEPIPGATIYYAASGVVNSGGWVAYTAPIPLTTGGVETILAYATETGYQQSGTSIATITMNLPTAPAPAFSPAAASYAGAQTVTISDSVAGATIYYTTNGTVPTANSAQYTGPITVSTSEPLAAVAVASGYSMSPVSSGQYFIGSSSTSFIYTVAGDGTFGYTGDNGQATLADLNFPMGTASDSAGNLYIADAANNVVRKVAAGTGIVTTVAGNGTAGYSGDNGPATSAELNLPWGVAIDPLGNLFISDTNNAVIRFVAAGSGVITTVAGTGTPGYGGDNGPASSAQLAYPVGIAADAAGNLYIADDGSNSLRKVAAGTGIITTVAGSGQYGYTGDGGFATSATLSGPDGVAVDSAGNLYIADTYNNVIRKVTASTKTISTVAGTGPKGNVYSGGYSGDGGPATSAKLHSPLGVAVDTAGNIYIADWLNHAIREVTVGNGTIATVAGNGSQCNSLGGDGDPATNAALCYPHGVAVDSAGNFYIADSSSSRIRKVTVSSLTPATAAAAPAFSVAAGTYPGPQTVTLSDATPGAAIYLTLDGSTPSTVSPGYNGPINVTGTVTIKAVAVAPGYLPSAPVTAAYTITLPPTAIISTVAGNGVYGFSGAGGPALSAELAYPRGLAIDGTGNLYFADSSNNVVWEISATTGNIAVVAGNGTAGASGDGGPATSAQLDNPIGVAVDSTGNLYIADNFNNEIRKVTAATGAISTIAGSPNRGGYAGHIGDGGFATAASLDEPAGLALDSAGNLYIADTYNRAVRKITASTGIITTVAGNGVSGFGGDGGPATSASLDTPIALALDSAGNLYISDVSGGRIRKVTASSGIITTVAGNGDQNGSSGDGGLATNAEIDAEGLAVDSAGNLYASSWPSAVRKISASTGIIDKVAGNGYCGFSGDGGSATVAGVCAPQGIAFDAAGNLYIADAANYRIRKVTFPAPAPAPTFNLATGTYVGVQTVTMSDTIKGAAIYYTTDGSTPTTGSTLYSAPIPVSKSETLQAIAVAAGYTESAATKATYTIKILVVPTVTWPTPAPIVFGTALSNTQLNATASVPGTFVYTPAAGAVPAVGSDTLSVQFTPTDLADYTTASATVTLVVNNPGSFVGSLSPAFTSAGSAAFTLTVNGSGFGTTSTVYWGATALATQYGSANQLTAQVTAAEVASQGTTAITVQGPAGGGASNSLEFEVDSSAAGTSTPPAFTTLTATVTAGSTTSYPVTLPSSATNVSVTCLNLPAGATCTYSSAANAVTIATSATTPKGTYQVTVVFTETLPGAATAGILLPILLLPLFFLRRRLAARGLWLPACLGLVLMAAAAFATGCGGGGGGATTTPPVNPTHQVTNSGAVSLTIQ